MKRMIENQIYVLRLLCAVVALASMACGTSGTAKRLSSDQQIMAQELYSSQLEMYEVLEQSLFELGREYFVIGQEYEDMGRSDLATLAQRRAQDLHKRHQEVTNKKNETLARLRQLLDSGTVKDRGYRVEQPAQPQQPRVRVQQQPARQPAQTPVPQPAPRQVPQPAPQQPAQVIPPPQPQQPAPTPAPTPQPTPQPTPNPPVVPRPPPAVPPIQN